MLSLILPPSMCPCAFSRQAEAQLNKLIEHFHSVTAVGHVPNGSKPGANATGHSIFENKLSLFLMTDLVHRRLHKTFVTGLPSKGVRIVTSDKLPHIPQEVGRLLKLSEIGLYGNNVQNLLSTSLRDSTASRRCDSKALLNLWMQRTRDMATVDVKHVHALEDLMLFFEQAICCFNTLGLITTARSTVSGLILATKAGGHCQTNLTCFKM